MTPNGLRYAVVIFYGFEPLNKIDMNIDRIKEIQRETAYPDSVSVQQALLKVWNECEQELVSVSFLSVGGAKLE